MRKVLVGLLVLGLASVASAGVVNGTFDDGLNGWTNAGVGLQSAGDWSVPPSPSGGSWAGVIMSWGGDWGGPVGSLSQVITGITGNQTLSGELYSGARAADAWRNVNVEVLWNDAVVASLPRDAANAWAGDFTWNSFSVPVTGTGNDTLAVRYTIHFAEWSWTGVDNLAVTPEPATLALLALGLPLLRRRR